MTWPEFKKKWSRYSSKESSAYQEHFNDLCRLLGYPRLVSMDTDCAGKLKKRTLTNRAYLDTTTIMGGVNGSPPSRNKHQPVGGS